MVCNIDGFDASRAISARGTDEPRYMRLLSRPGRLAVIGMAGLAATIAMPAVASAAPSSSFLSHFSTVTVGPTTMPSNQDVNPYGVAEVGYSTGRLIAGDTLVSNFNNSSNAQGTGTTIVEISPRGRQFLFSQINPGSLPGPCPGGIGLTTALNILPDGWVVVGSLPTSDGTGATAQAGCLLVLDSQGTCARRGQAVASTVRGT